MKLSSWASLLFLSCYFMAFPSVIGSEQARRLHSMMKASIASASGQVKEKTCSNVRRDVDQTGHVHVGPQQGLMEADRILELPGQPTKVEFDQYAGYVTVDPNSGRALFYYFVEAAEAASKKPLVLWLNGGPGCSSFGYGGMQELGPFYVKKDGKTLYINKHSWNKAANILFLESPAGVGFSYSNKTSDYNIIGDLLTAQDSYTFLVNWLERFPQYKGRDFFIAGESYAGRYIPELALLINDSNHSNKTEESAIINLKGIAMGNAAIDALTAIRGAYDFLFSHAVISLEAHNEIQQKCIFELENYTQACGDVLHRVDTEVIHEVDYYNIYSPICKDSTNLSTLSGRVIASKSRDPCRSRYVSAYLNLPEVQRALHANTTGLNYKWSACSNLVNNSNWNGMLPSTVPILKDLIADGIRIWLYSGDFDAAVPVRSTQYDLDALNLPVETPWRAWSANNEIAGFVTEYKGVVFATVQGAGHMVPMDQPKRSLILFRSFLNGELPPQ